MGLPTDLLFLIRRGACGILFVGFLLIHVTGAWAQQPQINSLSDTSLARSGRLLIFGSDFGAQQGSGQVLIDGIPAIATTWTDMEVHAYVPETASLATVTVQVETSAGTSNAELLEVAVRQSEGRFRWRFEMDSRATGAWSAVGPDGTIYCSDEIRLYALSPDGGLKWVVDDAGGQRPISVSSDGVIYTATHLAAGETQGVIAINADGSTRWSYVADSGFDLLAGPSLGPDGNIYAVSNSNLGGDGTFALDSDGNLLWTNPGPGSNGITNYEILFDATQIYVPIWGQGGGPEILTYNYDGDLLWTSGDLGLAPGSAPELDPFGRLVLQWGTIGVQAWSPDGDVEWTYDPPGTLGLVVPPTVGPDGVIYSGTYGGGDLFAIHPDGTTKWLIENQVDGFLWHLAVSPDNRLLIDGGSPDFGVPSSVRAFDTANGEPLWIQNFHIENGLNEFAAWIEPTFSADGMTLYVNTRFSSNTQAGYFYAVDLSAEGIIGDVNGDGVVNLLDVAPFIELLSTGAYQVEADINQDGMVNLLDVQPFIDLLAG